MAHRSNPRFNTHLPLMCLLVLALASPVSAEWKEKVLYSFQGGADAGSVPAGGVVFDKQGNLYGVTSDGGGVYQLRPPAKKGDPWTESVLYVFKGNTDGDGATPEGGLIIDSVGNLYGTTAYGGTGNCLLLGTLVGCGTVYELSPPKHKGGSWTETVLYSFLSAKQGYFPWGNLTFDSAGNLYGATQFGGGHGTTCDAYYEYCGTVFELTPPKKKGWKWTEKVLHGFESGKDGANPNGGLILDSKGAIFGTTYAGGTQNCTYQGYVGCGTAFKLSPSSSNDGDWTEKQLYVFTAGDDGSNPNGGLIVDATGALYGTGGGGANEGQGVIFRLKNAGGGRWENTTMYTFPSDGQNGSSPMAGLVLDAEGTFYGTASGGGAVGDGTAFRLRPVGKSSWECAVIYDFKGAPDGSYPASALIFDPAGNLYGTTRYSGSGQACGNYGCGTVFEVSP